MTTIRAGGVKGPASTTDGFMTVFDGTTGKTIKAHASGAPGTAAFKNTGTSGDTIPKNDTANTFTGTQTVNGLLVVQDTVADVAFVIRSDDTSANGPSLVTRRVSASPAANDGLGAFSFQGKTSTAATQNYAFLIGKIQDPTNGAEYGQLDIVARQNAVNAIAMRIGAGVFHPSATGTDKGANTINFGAVYDDNVLLTDIVQEAVATGSVDLERWDALVPDWVEPEIVEEVQITERVKHKEVARNRQGDLVLREVEVEVPVMEWEPIHDEKGNGVDAVQTPVTEIRVRPAKPIKRVHYAARILKSMCEQGFKPGDYKSVCQWWKQTNTMPGMPAASEWEQSKYSLGEMTTRSWMAKEIIMAAFANLAAKVDDLDARVTALESGRLGR